MTETLGQLRARIRRESEEALALLAEFGLHGKWSQPPVRVRDLIART